MSRMYICTTSSPAARPVLVTSTSTRVDSPIADSLLRQARRSRTERGIAQSEAECEQRATIVKQISAPGGRLVVVVGRNMADRPRDGDRKLAAGIDVSEEDFRHCPAGLLAEIPALENGRRLVGDVADRDRAAVEEKRDDRFSRGGDGVDQFILTADQVEAGAVAQVVQSPMLRATSARCRRSQGSRRRPLRRRSTASRDAPAVLFRIARQ